MRRTALQNHSADGFGPQIVQWKEEAASEPVFVKGTEFAAFRPPEASLTMTGEEATVADLRDVAGVLQHLEEKMARIQAEVRKVDERRALLHRGRKDRGKGVALSKKDRAQIGRVKKALNPEAEALESAGPQSSAITDMAALNTKLEQRCAKIHRIREFQESHEGELDIWDDD